MVVVKTTLRTTTPRCQQKCVEMTESRIARIQNCTNPELLRSCFCFQVFRLNFAASFFNLLLVRFHQARIIVVKHLIQERVNEAWVGIEPSTLRSWSSSKRSYELLILTAIEFWSFIISTVSFVT